MLNDIITMTMVHCTCMWGGPCNDIAAFFQYDLYGTWDSLMHYDSNDTYDTVWHSMTHMTQYDTYDTVWCIMTHMTYDTYDTVWCIMTHMTQYDTYDTVWHIWYSMMHYDTVWHSMTHMTQYDTVWCIMTQYDLILQQVRGRKCSRDGPHFETTSAPTKTTLLWCYGEFEKSGPLIYRVM